MSQVEVSCFYGQNSAHIFLWEPKIKIKNRFLRKRHAIQYHEKKSGQKSSWPNLLGIQIKM